MVENTSRHLRAFLRKTDVFSGLEGRSLDSVLKVIQEHRVPKGTVMFEEGELGRTMFVLVEGQVEVLRHNAAGRPVPLVTLGPGECFGEMALVEMEPRSATVVATQKSRAYSLTNLDLWKLFQQDQYAYVIVLQNICRLLSRRLRKADTRLSEFLTPPPPKPARARTRATGARVRGG